MGNMATIDAFGCVDSVKIFSREHRGGSPWISQGGHNIFLQDYNDTVRTGKQRDNDSLQSMETTKLLRRARTEKGTLSGKSVEARINTD
jgi:hypothetical protein